MTTEAHRRLHAAEREHKRQKKLYRRDPNPQTLRSLKVLEKVMAALQLRINQQAKHTVRGAVKPALKPHPIAWAK